MINTIARENTKRITDAMMMPLTFKQLVDLHDYAEDLAEAKPDVTIYATVRDYAVYKLQTDFGNMTWA